MTSTAGGSTALDDNAARQLANATKTADKTSAMSFVLAGNIADEVGKALNEQGIALRTGRHCAQPILRRFSVETTVRPSWRSTTPSTKSTG